MKTPDFTTTLLVEQTPAAAFKAILDIGGWWSAGLEGETDKVNAEFFYHFKDIHYCKARLIELVPDERAVWLVLDNYFKFTDDKSEWNGTKIIFDISRKDDQTAITFTHEGLVPQYECYEICRDAWTGYIMDSLRELIADGKGRPNPAEEEAIETELFEKWKQTARN